MTITTMIAVATCLLSSLALTQGSKIGLLRTELFNARRLQTLTSTKLTLTDTDLQSAFRELLGYSHQWDSSMSMSMSMSMHYNTPTVSPVASPTTTTVRSTSPTTAPPSLRSPTVAPVVAENPTTRVIPIKTDTTKPNQQQQRQNASPRRRLSIGAIAGIAIVAAVVVVVSAMMVKNRSANSAL